MIQINYIYNKEITSVVTNQEKGWWYTTIT